MAGNSKASFPQVTVSASGQWPLLVPTYDDLHWKPAPGAKTRPLPVVTTPAPPRRKLYLGRRLPVAALKGGVLAAMVVGVVIGVVPAGAWWLSDWRWAGAFMMVAGLAALIGADAGLLALAAIATVQALGPLPAHLPLAGALAAGVLVGRIGWELVLALAVS